MGLAKGCKPGACMAVAVLAVCLAAVPATAGEKLHTLETFEDVLVQSLEVSHTVFQGELEKLEAEAALEEVQSLLRPQLNIGGEHTRQKAAMDPMSTLEGASLDDVIWDAELSVTAAQQLGASPELQGGLDQAELGVAVSELQYRQAVIESMLEVQESYHALLQTDLAVDMALKSWEDALAELDAVKEKRDQRAASELDVMEQQNEVFQREVQLESAKSAFRLAGTRLLQLLDMYPSGKEELENWAEVHRRRADADVMPWEPTMDELWEHAKNHRPEIRLLDKQVEMAAIEYDTARRDRDWTVTASGTYIWNETALAGSVDSDRMLTGTMARTWEKDREEPDEVWDLPEEPPDFWVDEGFSEDDWDEFRDIFDQPLDPIFDDPMEDTNPWQISLSVNYQFGDGGAASAEESRLQTAVQKADSERASAKDMLFLEVYAAREDMEEAYRSWKLALDHQKEAEETFSRIEDSAKRGLLSTRELQQAELLLIQAENEVLSSTFEYREQKAALAQAAGVDDEQMAESISGGDWPQWD